MIKIGKLTDYAVTIMGHMLQEDTQSSRSASYIAEITGVPEPTVAKILKKLSQGDLISSVRGAAGGYKVNRKADDISVAEIITILEGPICLVACCSSDEVNNCLAYECCMFKGKWEKINDKLIAIFKEVKLQDMMDSPCNIESNTVLLSEVALD